jgi:pimeloyl-ACP methyl ester carboxylesterase
VATFVLIHGAGTDAWCWGPLGAELRGRGHDVVAPDLPVEDESAGLEVYADTVVGVVRDRLGVGSGLTVVAHSFGGFTGPLVCERLPVELLVMLHAQIPAPGESPRDWWTDTGYEQARREQDERDARAGLPAEGDDPLAFALHDTPGELAAEMMRHQRKQSGAPFGGRWPLAAWPEVPTRVLLARDDRFFPAGFLRRLALERLGVTAEVMPGDHCPMLGHPKELADRLEAYRRPVA